ncbi:MAG: CCA tRNA nucleotidyltransferase [Coriobacteriales bacterium]|nr:CCA tRNA nucleotidyltransferase [Coriobacteriales bacterium]
MDTATLNIPHFAQRVVARLHACGHQAYLVGGCVRDSLLGTTPKDWDVATSALPQEVQACCAATPDSPALPVIATGIQHGTVTVLVDGSPVEVTTFRQDGPYLDNRHPESVSFISSLREDLARRDFTINAMALDVSGATDAAGATGGIGAADATGATGATGKATAPSATGTLDAPGTPNTTRPQPQPSPATLIDPFGGLADLEAGIIRTVGDPDARFAEDGLRLMRALRFSATLGFAIEPHTAAAIHRNRELLANSAPERFVAELMRLLPSPNSKAVLDAYPDVLAVLIPEISPAVGFDQHNRHHCYDVWEHTTCAICAAPPNPLVRLALVFHDLGKPPAFRLDSNGVGHFYGHAALSAQLARARLAALRFDNATIETVCLLVESHMLDLSGKTLLRALRNLGEARVRLLLDVKRADGSATAAPYVAQRLAHAAEATAELERILAEERCFKLKDLAISGHDLLAAGIPEGPQIGALLEALLDEVIEGSLPNEREALLAYASGMNSGSQSSSTSSSLPAG